MLPINAFIKKRMNEIAYLLPRVAGNAVYTTSVMLGLLIIDTETYAAKTSKINTTNENSDLRIYPNPNDGTFSIALKYDDSEELAQVLVFDIQGKKIHSTNLNKDQINYISIPQISKGMYFIKINLGQNLIYSNKIEVIR